jgi:hypothetical protein
MSNKEPTNESISSDEILSTSEEDIYLIDEPQNRSRKYAKNNNRRQYHPRLRSSVDLKNQTESVLQKCMYAIDYRNNHEGFNSELNKEYLYWILSIKTAQKLDHMTEQKENYQKLIQDHRLRGWPSNYMFFAFDLPLYGVKSSEYNKFQRDCVILFQEIVERDNLEMKLREILDTDSIIIRVPADPKEWPDARPCILIQYKLLDVKDHHKVYKRRVKELTLDYLEDEESRKYNMNKKKKIRHFLNGVENFFTPS